MIFLHDVSRIGGLRKTITFRKYDVKAISGAEARQDAGFGKMAGADGQTLFSGYQGDIELFKSSKGTIDLSPHLLVLESTSWCPA